MEFTKATMSREAVQFAAECILCGLHDMAQDSAPWQWTDPPCLFPSPAEPGETAKEHQEREAKDAKRRKSYEKQVKDAANDYFKNRNAISDQINGAVEQVGWSLSILYAQLTHDGMGVTEATDYLKINAKDLMELIDKVAGGEIRIVNHRDGEGKPINSGMSPDLFPVKELAKKFADLVVEMQEAEDEINKDSSDLHLPNEYDFSR